jgi:hypothetical protein
MKQGLLALILWFFCSVVVADAPSFAGSYHCKGFDPYLKKPYTGVVKIKPQNTVYSLDMDYDTGDHDNGTGGMYDKTLLFVVFQDPKNLKHVGLEQYRFSDNFSKISGFWVYLNEDKLGTEICDRDADAGNIALAK